MTVKLIAEIGVNWSTIDEAKEMITKADEAGAFAVKFQLFNKTNIEDSVKRDELANRILSARDLAILKRHAKSLSLAFILTPMYPEAVEIADKYADLIKIRCKDSYYGSPILDKAEDTGKRLIISVERRPLNTYSPYKDYLYCIPKYPPEIEDFDLAIATTCEGFSSHFPQIVCDLAFAINRSFKDGWIEKHVMINGTKPIDSDVSITFDQLSELSKQLKIVERIKRLRL